MLTLNNVEVYQTLRDIALKTFPEQAGMIRSFRVNIMSTESQTRHGDYTMPARDIRIFNLSRPTPNIIKTSVHELAHHVDYCFQGRTSHDKQFYAVYKSLLECAHREGIINIADVIDEIDSRDMGAMVKKVGAPAYAAQTRRSGYLFKVDNAFSIKDQLKEHGYRFSATEKLWIKEVPDTERESEEEWVGELTGANNIRIIAAAENTIDSIYFGIVGKKLAPAFNEELKRLGFKFDRLRGWYKRIPAADKTEFSNLCEIKFNVTPRFTGTL